MAYVEGFPLIGPHGGLGSVGQGMGQHLSILSAISCNFVHVLVHLELPGAKVCGAMQCSTLFWLPGRLPPSPPRSRRLRKWVGRFHTLMSTWSCDYLLELPTIFASPCSLSGGKGASPSHTHFSHDLSIVHPTFFRPATPLIRHSEPHIYE